MGAWASQENLKQRLEEKVVICLKWRIRLKKKKQKTGTLFESPGSPLAQLPTDLWVPVLVLECHGVCKLEVGMYVCVCVCWGMCEMACQLPGEFSIEPSLRFSL